MYQYKAFVTKVYDGDTITCDINLGLGLILQKQRIRLFGINAPELKEKNGKISRDALREKLLNKEILIKTVKDKKGKYGRLLGVLFLDGLNINDWLVENNYAEVNLYGNKPFFAKTECEEPLAISVAGATTIKQNEIIKS